MRLRPWAVLGGLAAAGCATTGTTERRQLDFAVVPAGEASGLHAGEARVISGRVNPNHPIRLTPASGALQVSFAERGRLGSVTTLDSVSLEPVAREARVQHDSPAPPSMVASRVTLRDGRYVVCWTEGGVEWGRRAMAQGFEADGAPIGAPIALSPAEADVFGAPLAATADGLRVVAVFPAASSGEFQLMAVSIDGR